MVYGLRGFSLIVACITLIKQTVSACFSHGYLPEAGREIQTELDRRDDDAGRRRILSKKPAGGKT